MKSLFINIKDLLPYLLIVILYFVLVNIEASKNDLRVKENNVNIEENIELIDNKSDYHQNYRITIPVIPYEQ